MKFLKYFLAFLAFSAVFVSCEEEEINIVLDGISAPSNLGAVFNIADDDTGTVTVTPTGIGASSFNVFFGDVENETATVVLPGETVTKTYLEGEYILRIEAVGPTGLTSELSRVITISFTQPENLDFTPVISPNNPFEVTVTPTADNAAVFDVFFGDVEDETPVTIMAGETATKIYSEVGTYTVRVVARSASVNTIELEKTIEITGASDPLLLPITFDDPNVNYGATAFGGASYAIVVNPDPSGANDTESNVGAITTAGDLFQGATWTLSEPADFSGSNKTLQVKVWSNVAFPVLLKLEEGPNGERANEVLVQHGGTGWELLSFNFATDAVKSFIDGSQGVGEAFVPEGQYDGLSLFLDFNGSATAGTFYVDDFQFEDVATGPLELPITFDDPVVAYDGTAFGGASYEVLANPDESGANAVASNVGAVTTAGDLFQGVTLELDTPADMSGDNKTIQMKLWSDVAFPVLFKFEEGPNGERANEVLVNHGGTGWELLTFNFATDAVKSFIDGSQGVGEPFIPTGQYNAVSIFFDFNGSRAAGTFYIDDIGFEGNTGGQLALPQLPIDFEGNFDYTWAGFGNADFGPIPAGVLANPDMSGINTSATVTFIEKPAGAQVWAGASLNLDGGIDFSQTTVITMQVWSPRSGTDFLLKLEDTNSPPDGNGSPTVFVEVIQSTSMANAWEELSFDISTSTNQAFNNGNTYDRLVVFPDFGTGGSGDTFYVDNVQLQGEGGGGNMDPLALPVTFDNMDVDYAFGTFNGASYDIVDNPDASGANPSVSKVGAITNSGNNFEGGAFNLDDPVDFSGANKVIEMKFWSNVAVPILLKFEGGVNGERQNEVVANHGGTGWEVLTFDFSTDAIKSFIDGSQGVGEPFVPTGQYATLVLFVDGPGTTAGTFYMDDIQFAMGDLKLPITFDDASVDYAFGTFNGASYDLVDNPDQSGANAVATKVGAITNSGNNFEGGAFNLDVPADFSGSNKTIVMKFWSTSAVPVLLKFEGGVSGERENEVVANHGGTGWETLTFNFSTDAVKSFIDGSQGVGEPFVPDGQYGTLVLFVDGPGTTAGTFYVDDISFE